MEDSHFDRGLFGVRHWQEQSKSLHGLSPCALNFNFLRFRNPKSHRDLSQVSALLGSFKAGEVWACVIKLLFCGSLRFPQTLV